LSLATRTALPQLAPASAMISAPVVSVADSASMRAGAAARREKGSRQRRTEAGAKV